MNHRIAIATVACLISLSACAPKADDASAGSTTAASATPAVDPATVRSTIDAANAQMVAGMLAGDAAAVSANYADDAVGMMAGMPAARGRAAIQEGFTGMLGAMSVKAAKFTTEDVMLGGDMAIEAGSYTMTLQPKSGAAIEDKGKYMTVWKRQADGSWKIVRDINNSDAAPGA